VISGQAFKKYAPFDLQNIEPVYPSDQIHHKGMIGRGGGKQFYRGEVAKIEAAFDTRIVVRAVKVVEVCLHPSDEEIVAAFLCIHVAPDLTAEWLWRSDRTTDRTDNVFRSNKIRNAVCIAVKQVPGTTWEVAAP